MDGLPPEGSSAGALPPEPPAYVYAANDFRPRQEREIVLCERASSFDWRYSGAMAAGVVGSLYVSFGVVKQSETPGVRLLGPGLVGFFWGGFLSGTYLSLPKCDPMWVSGAPPEGNVRAAWPLAVTIAMLSGATAPAIDAIFVGQPAPIHWTDSERAGRLFIAMGAGLAGSLFPYVVPPRTWAAKLELEKIRIGEVAGGPFVSYGATF